MVLRDFRIRFGLDMSVPIPADFKEGYLAYQKHAKRDSMYRTATFLVGHFWGKPAEMADSLGVLLGSVDISSKPNECADKT